MRKLIILLACAASFAAAACNTVEGAGKDLRAAGQGVENAAQDAK